jgi:uncharacterized protein (UPF0333 family)
MEKVMNVWREYFLLRIPILAAAVVVIIIIVGWYLLSPAITNTNIQKAKALGATTTTNNDIILGNPIYTEIDKATSQKSIVVNGTTTTAHATEITFSGHGTAKGINYTDNGKALVIPRRWSSYQY